MSYLLHLDFIFLLKTLENFLFFNDTLVAILKPIAIGGSAFFYFVFLDGSSRRQIEELREEKAKLEAIKKKTKPGVGYAPVFWKIFEIDVLIEKKQETIALTEKGKVGAVCATVLYLLYKAFF